jgi:hypothetical protein
MVVLSGFAAGIKVAGILPLPATLIAISLTLRSA